MILLPVHGGFICFCNIFFCNLLQTKFISLAFRHTKQKQAARSKQRKLLKKFSGTWVAQKVAAVVNPWFTVFAFIVQIGKCL